MSTKRSQNKCAECGNTWYPRGKDISSRCPSCGSPSVKISMGCIGTIIYSIFRSIFSLSKIALIVLLIAFVGTIFSIIVFKKDFSNKDSKPLLAEKPLQEQAEKEIVISNKEPTNIKPKINKPEVQTPIVKTFEDMTFPFSITTREEISLLDETGKETKIPARTIIKVLARAKLGSLTMQINGKTFVGNESRLIDLSDVIEK